MKVGLFFGSFTGGGAERMMINLAKGLSARKIEVTIYVVNKTGPYLKEVPNNINIHSYQARFGVKSVIHKIRGTLKNDGLTVLISTQMHINALVGLANIGLRSKTTVMFRESNTPSKIIDSPILKNFFKVTYKLADHLIAVSEGVKHDLESYLDLPSQKISVIYNPVVDESIKMKMDAEVAHPWFNSAPKERVIISAGRFLPQKNFEFLIEAFAIVRSRIKAKLIILGDSDKDLNYTNMLNQTVEKLNLKEHVDFPGFVDNPFKYFSNASLFALSSRFEGLPGVLIQALACGCPVVSTNCPSGPAEILENGKYGSLVEVGDVQGLADAMILALKNPINQRKLKERATYFSVGNAVENYIDLLKQYSS